MPGWGSVASGCAPKGIPGQLFPDRSELTAGAERRTSLDSWRARKLTVYTHTTAPTRHSRSVSRNTHPTPSPPSRMRLALSTSLLATLVCAATATAAAADSLRSADVFAWPASASAPLPLARISYSWPALNATVDSYAAPAVSGDEAVRVGVHRAGDWVGVAASASSFEAHKRPTLRLFVDDGGEVWHVGFSAFGAAAAAAAKPAQGRLAVEVVPLRRGPQVALDKPVVVNEKGEDPDKPEEKTFLQKYWWAIALFLLVQVTMGGGGDGK